MSRSLQRGDRGASLMIVLIIITSVSLVMGVLITQADTSMRTTRSLRDQAAGNYAADAAVQAVLTQVRYEREAHGAGPLSCSSTATPSAFSFGSAAAPFYDPGSGTKAFNASATCVGDDATKETVTTGTEISYDNLPEGALLTVGTDLNEKGIEAVNSGNNSWRFCVSAGSVRSNNAIQAATVNGTSNISVGQYVAPGDETNCANTPAPAGSVTAPTQSLCPAIPLSPSPCTGRFPNGTDPSTPGYKVDTPEYNSPPAYTTAQSLNPAPVCRSTGTGSSRKWYAAFLPGRYTRVSHASLPSLNSPCLDGSTPVRAQAIWFTPGNYFFDFGARWWNIPKVLLGGTPTTTDGNAAAWAVPAPPSPPAGGWTAATLSAARLNLASRTFENLSSNQASAYANNNLIPWNRIDGCADPAKQSTYAGVTFVFGGASAMNLDTGRTTICATYAETAVPVAIYGMPTTGGPVPIQSGCIATVGCTDDPSIERGSSLFHQTPGAVTNPLDNASDLHIYGLVYTPLTAITLVANYDFRHVFNWGLIARKFKVTSDNTISGNYSIVRVPPISFVTETNYPISYINVWTCPKDTPPLNGMACPQGGPETATVRVKADTNDDAPPYEVLSWSHQRP